MADEQTEPTDEQDKDQAAKPAKKSNEVTERDKVKDRGYVQRIEEKTEKH